MKRITDVKNGLRWVNLFNVNDYCYHRIVWDDVYNGFRDINDVIALQKFIRIYQRNFYLK